MATAKASSTDNRLTSISIENFKSISSPQVVQVRGLTLLAGANSSGKSSAMQPLLLMKQTLEATYDPGTFLLDGPIVRFTSAKQILSIGKKYFTVGFGFVQNIEASLTYVAQESVGLEVARLSTTADKEPTQNTYPGMGHDHMQSLMGDSMDKLFPFAEMAKYFKNFKVTKDRCLLDLGPYDIPSGMFRGLDIRVEAGSSQRDIKENLLGMLYLPGLRRNPERTSQKTATSNPFPGPFDVYYASIIHQWKIASEKSKIAELGATMAELGLTSAVISEQVDETRIELKVARVDSPTPLRGKSDFVSIADVGIGVSQVLPVIVALQVAVRNQIVYLEQPEIHLHPRAQVALAAVIARAVKRGVIVIAETHSSLLLRGIQTLVAEGELPGKDVALHWFQRNPRTGKTKISHTELDEDGAFGDWPADFDDIQLGSSRQYLDAVAKRHLG